MSRSHRKPYTEYCYGARPKQGKAKTSRHLRRLVKQKLSEEEKEFDFHHIQDKARGKSGSKAEDYGSMYFGDGRHYFPKEETKRK